MKRTSLLTVLAFASCGFSGVLMMSEGPQTDGSIGWQPFQKLMIPALLAAGVVLLIVAARK